MTPAPGRAEEIPAKSYDDGRLVALCLKGDEAAWSALIDKYKNLIFSIPINYGLSREDAADIFQAVCVDLLAQLPNIREPNALAGWLIQVTRNKCFHYKKDQQRLSVQELDEQEVLDKKEAPEELISRVEREQSLREALAGLPPRCQQLVRMLFYETPPRPYQQVAEVLHLAQGSIGFIRQRCLNKLRQLVGKALDE